MRCRALLALLLGALLGAAPPRPRLVVVISVDQLSAELMDRWGGGLRGGLGTLEREGLAFTQAYHEHGFTETGPGHSVLLSGRHPASTGIVENHWLDRATGRRVYCVEDAAVRTLGRRDGRGYSPALFQGSTLGGWLKEQVPGSRVFSISGKERSAILMAGPGADEVLWFGNGVGFTTSTYYEARLPPWLEALNRDLLAGLRGPLSWNPLRAVEGRQGAGRWVVNGTVVEAGLPRSLVAGRGPWGEADWEAWRASPHLDAAVLRGAKALMAARRLGRGPGTDLLLVGLSATDRIGHLYGTAGPEMEDQVRRLDGTLGAFLRELRRADPGAWVVLTADHGGSDFPERLAATVPEARRVDPRAWLGSLRDRLKERFALRGNPIRPASVPTKLYLDDVVLGAVGATRADMLRAVAVEVRKMPDVVEVFTAAELEAMVLRPEATPPERSLGERLKLSYAPGRSADLFPVFGPHVITEGPPEEAAAAHRGPYDYDRRVPLFFWGPWTAGRREEPVRTVDLAATLAEQLGLRPSEPIAGRPLALPPRRGR